MKQECVPGENIENVLLTDPISLKGQKALHMSDFMPTSFGDYISLLTLLISIITCLFVCRNNRRIAYYGVTMRLREEKINAKKVFDSELESLQNKNPSHPYLTNLHQGILRMKKDLYQFSTPIQAKFDEMCRTVETVIETDDCRTKIVEQLKEIIQMMETEIKKMFG